MGEENIPESVFDIEEIVDQFTKALSVASFNLHEKFQSDEYEDLPFTYHIPQMNIELNLTLSYSKGQVKGLFTKKRTTETSQQESKVTLSVVSIPRTKKSRKIPSHRNQKWMLLFKS